MVADKQGCYFCEGPWQRPLLLSKKMGFFFVIFVGLLEKVIK